jgi:hypothetical protein
VTGRGRGSEKATTDAAQPNATKGRA